MTLRADWRELCDLLAGDAQLFVQAVRNVLKDRQRRTEFLLRNEPLPSTFLAYLRGPAVTLLVEESLDVDRTSAETTGVVRSAGRGGADIVAQLRTHPGPSRR
jgi:hypothetical protein